MLSAILGKLTKSALISVGGAVLAYVAAGLANGSLDLGAAGPIVAVVISWVLNTGWVAVKESSKRM